MFITIRSVYKEYNKWKDNWEDLCECCGRCCHQRYKDGAGEVHADFYAPCEFLDVNTSLCTVYEDRFNQCDSCGKLNLFRALFNPLLPDDCAYARTFRVWKR